MTPQQVVLPAALAAMWFALRGQFAVVWSASRMKAGDYDGALRRVRWASLGLRNLTVLHAEGIVLAMAGRCAEAAECYRAALAKPRGHYAKERLHACLGYALMDLGNYAEAERCFHRAIEAGDITGNSQDGLAELRLREGGDPAEALTYARQGIEHAKRKPGGRVPGAYYAHEAWALALLGRPDEARSSLERAGQDARTTPFQAAGLDWRAAMVLRALGDEDAARRHLQAGFAADPNGKYGRRCRDLLG